MLLDKTLTYIFYILFFFTPLLWVSTSFELFEYNKMMLVYILTVGATVTWILKILNSKSLIFKRTPQDIPLFIFLVSMILSTITSIDPHVSIWGYYSRSNGGLLSLISYTILYYILVSNFNPQQIFNFLKAGLWGGLVVSLYAIPEHFGLSPSCVILWGQYNTSCWVQNVQARVFATLGQPNWLAGYLAALIFPALYFLLTSNTSRKIALYSILTTLYYLAFTFTYSRGPTLGLLAGLLTFVTLLSISALNQKISGSSPKINPLQFLSVIQKKNFLIIILVFLLINLLFGSALTSFKLLSKFATTTRESVTTAITSVGTQLENGGSESGVIRLIVWRGAWDIFKNYPILGSGLETFAYSYYQFRPIEHNNTSEWDFLYNKAHNEYLNYLSTTGTVGFLSYMFLIFSFIIWSIRKIWDISSKQSGSSLALLHSALLSAYVSLLVYNFFLFSVVVTNLLFFLFPAMVFIVSGAVRLVPTPRFLLMIFSRRPFYTKALKTITVVIGIFLLFVLLQNYRADSLYNRGVKASDNGNPGLAYNLLTEAIEKNPSEPSYKSEFAFAAASAAVALAEEDATRSASLKQESEQTTEELLKDYPHNVSFFRTGIRTYFSLYTIDKSYLDKTLATIDSTIKLAPTDPKLYYNKGLVLKQEGQVDQAKENFKKAVEMKSNYQEAKSELEGT